MDPVEIAHSITIEAIRAGLNRPDEIKDLFKTVVEQARGEAPPPATVADDEDEDVRPQPDVVAEDVRPEPVVEPVVERAPLPSAAWREPEREEPPAARLSDEDIAASHGDEFIKCLECGQTRQQLKHHLKATHKMSIEDYKQKWGLPKEYPTVAPATRRRFQERGRLNYERSKAAGTGIAAHPGPKKPKEKAAA